MQSSPRYLPDLQVTTTHIICVGWLGETMRLDAAADWGQGT